MPLSAILSVFAAAIFLLSAAIGGDSVYLPLIGAALASIPFWLWLRRRLTR